MARRKSPHTLGPRPGEKIGSGIIVMGRVQPSGRLDAIRPPYEHPDLTSALTEAQRLAKAEPGRTFRVFMELVPK